MGEEIKATLTGSSNSSKYSHELPHSFLAKSRLGQSKIVQNYLQYRSAEDQRTFNSSAKSFLTIKKPANQLYMKNRTNLNQEEKTQEYSRYRNSTYHHPAKIHSLLVPCYSQLSRQNENEYSRYRDSRLSRSNSTSTNRLKAHIKCRSLIYDESKSRFPVPDTKVFWNVIFPDYAPVEYTTEKIQRNLKADPSDPSKIDKFNQIDKKIDRRSFTGVYQVDPITNRPRNPMGRTGVTGRGRLYYWGPNHAGDPVVTRWRRDENGDIVHRQINAHAQPKPVLEFVAIRRQDTKQWALPGGMVDPGEHVSLTIKREFQEEAMKDGGDKNLVDQLFSNGYKLYEYYVDDPRNTDNAWIETVAVNFHDETGQLTKNLHLNAGDDADKVFWCPIDQRLELYACHKDIIKAVIDRLDAYW